MKDDAAKELLDSVFRHSFDKDRFEQFIAELFNEFTFREASYGVWKEYSEYINRMRLLELIATRKRKRSKSSLSN